MFKRTIVAVITFAALLCSALTVDAAKPTQWLIYWYVCGTDIETTNIEFKPGTDLMSDDPNALLLASPDRTPGDVTRCINEVEKAALSPDVRIFMQAGGTYIWGHKKFRDLNAKIQTGLGEGNFIGNGNGFYEQWHLRSDLQPGTLISRGKIGRYIYDKHHRNWHAFEQLPITGKRGDPKELNNETDMGSQAGLISFLQAGQKLEHELYPDGNVRRILIMKNHGGGSLIGVCSDEYTGNLISLQELRNAFAKVKNGWTNPEEKPFEVVAFDACVMSTYETAVALEETANYMVASQESTFNKVALNYTDLLNELSKNPSMSGKELGKVICNTTWEDSKTVNKEFGFSATTAFTESVIDLSESKMTALKTAYANFGTEADKVAEGNPDVVDTFKKFKNAANVSERYSLLAGNPDMVDLKNFADNLKATYPELKEAGDALVKAIDNSVVYNKRGSAYKRGGGLSIYYPLDLLNSESSIQDYGQLADDNLAPESQHALYEFLYRSVRSEAEPILEPVLGDNGQQETDKNGNPLFNLKGWSIRRGGLFDFDWSKFNDKKVEVDPDKKTVRVELDEEELKAVESVRCQMIFMRPFTDSDGTEKAHALLLGGDSSMRENWSTGEFESAFRGKWLKLEDQLLAVQVVSDATRKNKHGKKIGGTELCMVLVLLNGEPHKMFISCEYPKEKFTIIGLVPTKDGQATLPNGELLGLKKGDIVTPIYTYEKVLKNGTPEVLENITGNPITIGNRAPKLELGTLPDGKYLYVFELTHPANAQKTYIMNDDEVAIFTVKDGAVVKAQHGEEVNTVEDLKD